MFRCENYSTVLWRYWYPIANSSMNMKIKIHEIYSRSLSPKRIIFCIIRSVCVRAYFFFNKFILYGKTKSFTLCIDRNILICCFMCLFCAKTAEEENENKSGKIIANHEHNTHRMIWFRVMFLPIPQSDLCFRLIKVFSNA